MLFDVMAGRWLQGRFAWLGVTVAALGMTACERAREVGLSEWQGEAMGTRWMLKVVLPHDRATEEAMQTVRGDVEAILERWEAAASTWRAESELSRINASPPGDWLEVGPDLWRAFGLARDIAAKTEGALDVTLEPLVRLWGFGREGRKTVPPPAAQVHDILKQCGWRQLEWDEANRRLRKRHAGVELNVNCVVEGLAMDDVAEHLKARGVRDFLFELGGEVVAAGWNRGEPWTVR